MRILIDECVHPRVSEAFPGHEVVTVASAQWRGLPDVQLVALAHGKFDVLVTIESGL